MQPLVSILIPCYNSEQWIGNAIESALGQAWPNKQVIVLDDGSTDNSLNVIRRYENQLTWETGPNRGGGYARNRLLALASGDWVQYLDADDYLLPEKVSDQASFVVQHPEVDIVIGPTTMEYWSEQGTRRGADRSARSPRFLDDAGLVEIAADRRSALAAQRNSRRRRLETRSALLPGARALSQAARRRKEVCLSRLRRIDLSAVERRNRLQAGHTGSASPKTGNRRQAQKHVRVRDN